MRTDFGEFQFGYSCTRELEAGGKWLPALGMPYIPTQNEEGSKLPFDVALGAFFLQYKVPDFLTRSNAREWGVLSPPGSFFRISVYPQSRSPQHNLMREFAKDKINVFYCAPGFNSYDEYSKLHLQRRIAESSAFIPIDQLPANHRSDRHSIVYRTNPLQFMWCSQEIVPVKGIVGAQALTRELRADHQIFGPIDSLVPRLRKVVSVLSEAKRTLRMADSRTPRLDQSDLVSPEIRQITEIATTAFSEHGLILGILSATGEPLIERSSGNG